MPILPNRPDRPDRPDRRPDRKPRPEKRHEKREDKIQLRLARAQVFKWGAIGLGIILAIIAMIKYG